MKFGAFSTDKVNNRSQLVKDIMCKTGPTEEEINTLKYFYNFEKYASYASRISVLPILYLLYRRKFFDKQSPFMIREILLAVGGIGYIAGCDIAANEYMWGNCHDIIKKYNKVMDSYSVDQETADLMKKKYMEQKKNKLYD